MELALHLSHEEVVYHDVVGWIVKFVLDSDQFEFSTHQLAVIKKVHGFQQTDEGTLGALKFRSHEIGYFEANQIDVLPAFVGEDGRSCFEKMVYEEIVVVEHEGGQHCIYFRGGCSCLGESGDA